jgi:hypothetical protein
VRWLFSLATGYHIRKRRQSGHPIIPKKPKKGKTNSNDGWNQPILSRQDSLGLRKQIFLGQQHKHRQKHNDHYHIGFGRKNLRNKNNG